MNEQQKELERAENPENGEMVEETETVEAAEAVESGEGEAEAVEEPLEALQRELEEQRAELERQWDELHRERRLDKLGRELEKRGISAGFAGFLMQDSDEESMERLEAFEGVFRESLAQAVLERMRGGMAPREPEVAEGYRRDELHGLTRREINSHWEEIMAALRD